MLMSPDAGKPRGGFNLEDFFVGRSTGRGEFSSWISRVKRGFDIVATGTFDDMTLRLQEDFHFDDGETDTKVWTFTKTGENTYIGDREGLVGKAAVTVLADKVTMSYVLDLPVDNGKSMRLKFNDTLILAAPGKVLNTARVSKFMLPVAHVAVDFNRT